MPPNEQHVRDLERVENVAETDFAKEGEPGHIIVRVRGGVASFDGCEYEYLIRAVRAQGSGDIGLNVDPLEDGNTSVYFA